MKKLLLVTLLSFSSLSLLSFAESSGTPDEDPVVKSLRDRFEKAKAPEESDLFNKIFKCKEISAMNEDFTQYDMMDLKFSKFDGFFVFDQKSNPMHGQYMVNNGTELIGAASTSNRGSKTPQYFSLRVDANGYLIGEYTGTQNSKCTLTPVVKALPSSQRVISYYICVQK
ncbi:MAG: hypothetical protein QE271_06015 [Bacteriovoracaceae bacterium]|nr:hypothetical protein [Bacteriovoracaceae bacterium]